MICVGIDVSKDKHDCFILNSAGKALAKPFSIPNNRSGFNSLLQKIFSFSSDPAQIKIGLEATGHFHLSILRFLLDSGLPTFVLNPLHTDRFRKAFSLRKAKTDSIDARTIAMILMSGLDLSPYQLSSYHIQELKSLSRYRFDRLQLRSKLKQSIPRLVHILFPELESLVSDLHLASVYALLYAFPGAAHIAQADPSSICSLLHDSSRGRFDLTTAHTLHQAASDSVGVPSLAKSLELQHTISLIRELDSEIAQIDQHILNIMDTLQPSITSIPGLGPITAAMIISEIGDFSRFDSPDKLLAFTGFAPSVHQSGHFSSDGSRSHMEKRGSRYLRYALFIAARGVCLHEPSFRAYLAKKRSEGKHYYVALSHAVKKLVRLIYAMQLSGEPFRKTA